MIVEAPEAILRLVAGLDAHDPPCEYDWGPHDTIGSENDRQPEKGEWLPLC